MNIIHINSCNFGSTGNIALQIAAETRKKGHTVYTACPKSRDNKKKTVENQIFIGNRISRNIHLALAKITGLNGCFSIFSTLLFLRKIKKLKIDLIHLHNLHNCYINIPLLFRFIKKNNLKTVWTLHDCWAFTGQCPHFTLIKCDKWKSKCDSCPQYKNYPSAYVDLTKLMYKKKKRWFTGVKDMTVVTPSQWLKDLVKKSFLKEYPVKVINNGIDLNVFKPTDSDFRKKYKIDSSKKILLGVAFDWGIRKGLDVFTELAKRLDSDKYQIVLVGTDTQIDGKLPDNIISVHRTQDQTELAEIYTASDLFVNPTREDNFPTVNMESLACGTPVITFNTGGSPEVIDEHCGDVVQSNGIEELIHKIINIFEVGVSTNEKRISKAQSFDKNIKFNEYVNLYEVTL